MAKLQKLNYKIVFRYILCAFTISSCALSKKGRHTTLSQETLVSMALKELNLEASKTDFISSKIGPDNTKETIVVVPEIVNEDEEVYELNTHIVIMNNTSGKVTHKYFESSKTNGWISNSIFIDSITIDTLNYKLNNSKKAFGIIVKFRSSSQPNPYTQESISLFTKEKNSLKKILDSYTIYESEGVVNVNINTCYADIKEAINELSVSNSKTNTYYDILIKNTNTQRVYQEDKNGDCNPKEKIISIEKKVLKFNNEVYIQK